ncbi:MAG: 6-bladed beta-propeller [Lentisphaeraceae bacterium]|nr:6-bladed beta-propeller [Lentisphaeraceae bacterium]
MNRRHFLKISGLTASGSIFAHENDNKTTIVGDSLSNPEIIGHGSHKYKVIADWGKLDKDKYPIINCHAMAQTKDGNLHALCDGIRNNFLVYNKDGKLLKAWGTEYTGAHGLELFEEDGKEHFILVDGGWAVRNDRGKASRESGRVVKITTDGKLVFSIGHPLTIGVYTPKMRFQPCDAAVGPNGDIYISDGYGSNWVLQYNKYGQFIRKFAGPTDPNPEARLKGAHGISIDLRDKSQPKLAVSSRSECKIKFYTLDGKYLETLNLPGAFAGQVAFQGDFGFTGVCWSRENGTGKRLPNSGFVTILDKSNKVISNPGGSQPKYSNNKLEPLQQATKTFMHVHDLCVDADQNIYVLQWNAKGSYPIKLEKI